MSDPIIKATVKYDDEAKGWRWWVGLIEGPAITSHDCGICGSRGRAQRKMDKVGKRFAARIATDARKPEELVYDLDEGGWREAR